MNKPVKIIIDNEKLRGSNLYDKRSFQNEWKCWSGNHF